MSPTWTAFSTVSISNGNAAGSGTPTVEPATTSAVDSTAVSCAYVPVTYAGRQKHFQYTTRTPYYIKAGTRWSKYASSAQKYPLARELQLL